MIRCSCGAMLTSVEDICETCLPARKPMRASLEQDYREKCAAMEEDMLGWKETAEAWERDARGLNTRALAAEAKLAEAVAALKRAKDDMTCGPEDGSHYCPNCDNSSFNARAHVELAIIAITKGAQP